MVDGQTLGHTSVEGTEVGITVYAPGALSSTLVEEDVVS